MAKKKTKSKGILHNQKPKPRSKPLPRIRLSFLLATMLVSSLGALAYLFKPIKLPSFAERDRQIRVSIIVKPELKQLEFIQAAEQQIFSSEQALVRQMTKVQQRLAAKRLHIFKSSLESWQVKFDLHKPVARINYGITRLVSDQGLVFGQADSKLHRSLPVIKGLTPKAKISLNQDQSIAVNDEFQANISEVLLLLDHGISYNIKYRSIVFDQVRGYQLTLEDRQIVVEIGQSPFTKKFKKLTKILESRTTRSMDSARIELDFKGKAFIKEIKL